jgi:hypothetical protein
MRWISAAAHLSFPPQIQHMGRGLCLGTWSSQAHGRAARRHRFPRWCSWGWQSHTGGLAALVRGADPHCLQHYRSGGHHRHHRGRLLDCAVMQHCCWRIPLTHAFTCHYHARRRPGRHRTRQHVEEACRGGGAPAVGCTAAIATILREPVAREGHWRLCSLPQPSAPVCRKSSDMARPHNPVVFVNTDAMGTAGPGGSAAGVNMICSSFQGWSREGFGNYRRRPRHKSAATMMFREMHPAAGSHHRAVQPYTVI